MKCNYKQYFILSVKLKMIFLYILQMRFVLYIITFLEEASYLYKAELILVFIILGFRLD
jgi:hypothetical protein